MSGCGIKKGRGLWLLLLSAIWVAVWTLPWCAKTADPEAAAAFSQTEMLFDAAAHSPEEENTEETSVKDSRSFQMVVVRETALPQPEGKRILIYHSHTWEAYAQTEDRYEETEKWRTKDNEHNVVAVGDALAAQLRALGCTVVHDTTAFEPPDYEQAYERSLDMLEERVRLGESYDLYIDLHRDALSSTSTLKRTVSIGGEDTARFMVLIGKGSGSGFIQKPEWEKNLIIAQRITDELNGMHENLCRDVKIKTGRFNQHIAPCCVLIECGNNLNTLEQVLCGVPYLAQAICNALDSE